MFGFGMLFNALCYFTIVIVCAISVHSTSFQIAKNITFISL